MAKDNQTVSFLFFLDKFPEVDLPISLGEEEHHIFSRQNEPLNPVMIGQYILPLEDEEVDDLTEFVACFRLPGLKDFHAIVYWKASLLSYQYTLVTLNKNGELIDKRVIAGTYYDGQQLTQSAATITQDLKIYVVSGQGDPSRQDYEASSSSAYRLQIGTSGKIVHL